MSCDPRVPNGKVPGGLPRESIDDSGDKSCGENSVKMIGIVDVARLAASV